MKATVVFTGRGLDITPAMKEFITEKLEKLTYIDMALLIDCEVGQTVAHKGKKDDFYVRFLITVPKAAVRLKKNGPEVYSLVDFMMPMLQEKLVQYKENLRKWEGSEAWPEPTVVEAHSQADESSVYAGYVPKIRKKVLAELTTVSVTEAIERMELMDRDFYVFKDISSGKISIISKQGTGYELLVPET